MQPSKNPTITTTKNRHKRLCTSPVAFSEKEICSRKKFFLDVRRRISKRHQKVTIIPSAKLKIKKNSNEPERIEQNQTKMISEIIDITKESSFTKRKKNREIKFRKADKNMLKKKKKRFSPKALENWTLKKQLIGYLFGNLSDWPKDDDMELFQRIKKALPADDTMKYESRINHIDWESVNTLHSWHWIIKMIEWDKGSGNESLFENRYPSENTRPTSANSAGSMYRDIFVATALSMN